MNYTDITNKIEDVFVPISALLVYRSMKDRNTVYVESYDMDDSGKPVNAHPLSVKESNALAKALRQTELKKTNFLQPKGILPDNVLYLDAEKGSVMWTSPAQEVSLFFTEKLPITSGKSFVPPLIWKANKQELFIYALNKAEKITEQTALYKAPFFNIYETGKVCMGTVEIKFPANCSLTEFMQLWEGYFFNSLFSHLIGEQSPVKGNIVQLWQSQMNTGRKFPLSVLKKSCYILQNILP